MRSKGNGWDNAPLKSVFATIKTELQVTALYPIPDEARGELFKYIVWYNRHRRHSFLQYLSPATYEQNILPELIAA